MLLLLKHVPRLWKLVAPQSSWLPTLQKYLSMQHAGRWKRVLLEHVLMCKFGASAYLVLCICHGCSPCQGHHFGTCTPKPFDSDIVSSFLL